MSNKARTKNRMIPLDVVLDLWAAGKTARQIVDAIGPVGGIKFSKQSIEKALTRARNRGDLRAVYRIPITASQLQSYENDPRSQGSTVAKFPRSQK